MTTHDRWRTLRDDIAHELRPTLRLAGPVVAAELGWMTMGLVDTVMVGRLGAEALGGVSIAGSLFMAVTIFGIGMLLGLDYLVSHAWGGGRTEEAHRSLVHGLYLAVGLSVPLMLLLAALSYHLHRFGIEPGVVRQARPYLLVVTSGLPLLLVFVALRRYLQAVGNVRPIMVAVILGNVLNLVLDYGLIFGRLGMPKLGTAGAAWATVIGRFVLLLFVSMAVILAERRKSTGLFRTSLRLEGERIRKLSELGLPAAAQITLEVGVFAVATMLAGRLGATALAAHQVALSIASFTFMVPLGISSAGAVRVGQALGAGDARHAGRAGWTAFFTGVSFMAFSAVALATFPRWLMGLFTPDPGVIAVGTNLLRVAALFQLFDGLQVVGSGVLRGTGDTRRPMIVNLIGHWGIGLPVGMLLAFGLHGGIYGLWGGLALGLMAVGTILLVIWMRRVQGLVAHPPSPVISSGTPEAPPGAP